MTADKPKAVSFDTLLFASGNNTGIEVPADLIDSLDSLGAGRRPAVDVVVNGYRFRNTVAVMGGKYLLSVSAAIRAETGLKGGDPIRVTLTVNDTPRTVEIPDDFAAALRAQPNIEAFFAALSNSLQRYHIDQIMGAKTADTRQRRIDKAVGLFAAGKQR